MSATDGHRLAALITKEAKQIVRDPSTILIALMLPLILIFLFGYGISLDTARTRVGVVLEGTSAPALGLAEAYQHSSWFDVTMARSIAQLRPLLLSDRIRAIIVIPADFGQQQARAGGGAIQIITDGSLPQTANFVAAHAEGVRTTWARDEAGIGERAARPAIELSPRYWFNPELKSRYSLLPGAIAIVMTMVGTLLTALVVAREWERGTMEAMMATPVSMIEFLASKFIPYFVLALLSMAVCALVAVFAFDVPFRGSLFALLLIASAFLVPALGQGLLISVAMKNQFAASQIALISGFLPSFLLSGFLFEISSMPKPIQAITYLTPASYLVSSLQTVFVSGDLWALFWRDIAAMLGFGVVFFALTLRMTRKGLD